MIQVLFPNCFLCFFLFSVLCIVRLEYLSHLWVDWVTMTCVTYLGVAWVPHEQVRPTSPSGDSWYQSAIGGEILSASMVTGAPIGNSSKQMERWVWYKLTKNASLEMSVGCLETWPMVKPSWTSLSKTNKLSENVEDLKGMIKLALKGYRAQLARLKGPSRGKLRDWRQSMRSCIRKSPSFKMLWPMWGQGQGKLLFCRVSRLRLSEPKPFNCAGGGHGLRKLYSVNGAILQSMGLKR